MTKTYDSKSRELAEHFLDEDFGSRANYADIVHRLALGIQQTVEDFCEDLNDPTPWCSYGHMTKASCDCGPIADNE